MSTFNVNEDQVEFLVILDTHTPSFKEIVPVSNPIIAKQILETKYPNAKTIAQTRIIHRYTD